MMAVSARHMQLLMDSQQEQPIKEPHLVPKSLLNLAE